MTINKNCFHVVKGTVFYYLKCGKEKLATALSLEGLENQIRNDLGAVEAHLVALDIFKTKHPNLS